MRGAEFTDRIVDWLANYKRTDKKDPEAAPANTFLHNGTFQNPKATLDIIQQNNEAWQDLVSGKIKSEKVEEFILTEYAK